jgi:mRNA interferase RelE/StbE
LQKYVVLLEKRASKNIDKLSSVDRKRVNEALFTLRDKGFSQELDIKKLQGYRNHYRIRVGKHRILFELERERTIIVYAVLPRGAAY